MGKDPPARQGRAHEEPVGVPSHVVDGGPLSAKVQVVPRPIAESADDETVAHHQAKARHIAVLEGTRGLGQDGILEVLLRWELVALHRGDLPQGQWCRSGLSFA